MPVLRKNSIAALPWVVMCSPYRAKTRNTICAIVTQHNGGHAVTALLPSSLGIVEIAARSVSDGLLPRLIIFRPLNPAFTLETAIWNSQIIVWPCIRAYQELVWSNSFPIRWKFSQKMKCAIRPFLPFCSIETSSTL